MRPLVTHPPFPPVQIGLSSYHVDMPTDEIQPAIRVVMMPRDTNEHGTIFGGIILSQIDVAGAVEARKHCAQHVVTVAIHEVRFMAPVYVGDLVSYYTKLLKIGNTSITVRVTVEAMRGHPPHTKARVTQAEVVYVAVDGAGKAVPVRGTGNPKSEFRNPKQI